MRSRHIRNASQNVPLVRVYHSRKQKSTSDPIDTGLEIDYVSSIAGKVIRKSEIPRYFKKTVFPHALFEPLIQTFNNPFSTQNQMASCFMNDLITFVQAAEYSRESFLEMNPFEILYKSGVENFDSNEFHAKVDNAAPVAFLLFFDAELLIGVTYCTPLTKDKTLVDRTIGYFTLYKGELISRKITENTLEYAQDGFKAGNIFSLNMNNIEESLAKLNIGLARTKILDETIPNWTNLIEGVVVIKLL